MWPQLGVRKMNKLKIAEIFYSIQGEGRFAGVPSVFLRTFGCNFQCRGFGLPSGETSTEPEEIAANIDQYKIYEDLPLANTGCDSYASWHPKFKHLSPLMTTREVADKMHSLIPNNEWIQGVGDDVHLVITGGEPLLGWQRAYPELLDMCMHRGLTNLTFETNGTQFLDLELIDYLSKYFTKMGRDKTNLTFSVSPKLSLSGERREEAIQPDIIKQYETIGMTYLKFVVANASDVEEAEQAVADYRKAGFRGPVYLMPVGGVSDIYHMNTKQIAELSMKKGYRYSPRLQVDIWRNAWGT